MFFLYKSCSLLWIYHSFFTNLISLDPMSYSFFQLRNWLISVELRRWTNAKRMYHSFLVRSPITKLVLDHKARTQRAIPKFCLVAKRKPSKLPTVTKGYPSVCPVAITRFPMQFFRDTMTQLHEHSISSIKTCAGLHNRPPLPKTPTDPRNRTINSHQSVKNVALPRFFSFFLFSFSHFHVFLFLKHFWYFQLVFSSFQNFASSHEANNISEMISNF